MKSIIGIFIICLLFAGCDNTPSADEQESARQEQIQKEGQAQAGLPGIHNFQEKKLMKMIYELRDNANIVNYVYLQSEYSGKLIYVGKCVGYPIPYATQYSNPSKLEESSTRGYLTLPQAEPNGLFMPSSADATWVMMLDSAGNPHPVYSEPKLFVSPFKLQLQ